MYFFFLVFLCQYCNFLSRKCKIKLKLKLKLKLIKFKIFVDFVLKRREKNVPKCETHWFSNCFGSLWSRLAKQAVGCHNNVCFYKSLFNNGFKMCLLNCYHHWLEFLSEIHRVFCSMPWKHFPEQTMLAQLSKWPIDINNDESGLLYHRPVGLTAEHSTVGNWPWGADRHTDYVGFVSLDYTTSQVVACGRSCIPFLWSCTVFGRGSARTRAF